jgi:hypothetical protein
VLGPGHTLVPRGHAEAMREAVDGLFRSDGYTPPAPEAYSRRTLTAQLAALLERTALR